jgi:hypothetical protein
MLSAPIILLVTAKEAYDAIGSPRRLAGTGALGRRIRCIAAGELPRYRLALSYLRTRSLYPFAVYTAIVGTGVIVWQVAL